MEFHANLPVEYFKVFSETIDLFLAFGELVSIDIRNNQFILSTFNHSRTAQCLVRLSPHFFQDYKLLRHGSTEDSLQLTVPNKSLNSLIKRNFASIDLIQTCQISILPPTPNTEPQFTMKLIYKNKAKRVKNMNYTNGDKIVPLYDKNKMNHFIMSTHNIRDCFSRFDARISDILLICSPHSITLSTYVEFLKNIIPSKYTYTVSSDRCIEYSIIDTVKMICILKEIQAIVNFFDYMDIPLHALFEDVGKSIVFIYQLKNIFMLDIALITQEVEELTEDSE